MGCPLSEHKRGRGKNVSEHFELNFLKIYLIVAPRVSAQVLRKCDWIRLLSGSDDDDDNDTTSTTTREPVVDGRIILRCILMI
jgi:hypothetical protein